MHVQIVLFQLKGVSEEEYAALCSDLAPAFASVPGLVSKVWLADSSKGTFGGVYFWKDRDAMEAFAKTELFKSVVTHPNLTNITSTDYAAMEAPTKITRGLFASD